MEVLAKKSLVALGLVVTSVSCDGLTREAPPLPEVLLVVDTNLPVPLVAARLRVDVYTEDGTWFDSSDFGRPDRRDWPASFSVYSDDESRERRVWVRLRAYPEGGVDTYEGERFRDVSDPFARVLGDGEPRLARNGLDTTPVTEPSPLLTVDRLVLVALKPETRGRVRVLLHGACVGTMASMGEGGRPTIGQSASCVAVAQTREPVRLEALEVDDVTTPTTNEVGTWLTKPCPPLAESDKRVCIPGGATILGSRENSDFSPGSASQLDSAPARVFGLTPFLIDRDELTVGELTAIVDSGYTGALPPTYDGPLAQPTPSSRMTACTWSLATKGRDDYPVTCASYRAAREICQYRGGDLATTAQWEHVATIAGHPTKMRYPWGPEAPTCERAVWGRIPLERTTPDCPGGAGPRVLSEGPGDVSASGVRGLYGSVSEWVRDDAAPFESAAWASVDLVDPVTSGVGPRREFRGMSWMSSSNRPTLRFVPLDVEGYPPVGVRCVYAVDAP